MLSSSKTSTELFKNTEDFSKIFLFSLSRFSDKSLSIQSPFFSLNLLLALKIRVFCLGLGLDVTISSPVLLLLCLSRLHSAGEQDFIPPLSRFFSKKLLSYQK